MTLAVLRLIGEELRKDRTARVIAQVPVAVATYLINEKREWLRTLEDKSETELFIVPNENIQTPEYSIKRVREDEMDLPENRQATYLMPTATEQPWSPAPRKTARRRQRRRRWRRCCQRPARRSRHRARRPPRRHPRRRAAQGGGFWARFKKMLAGEPQPASTQAAAPAEGAPVRAPRREEAPRHDGRRDRPRHSRSADGARRDRGDGRRSEGRDRNRGERDHRDRDRNRGGEGRRPERSGERAGGAPRADSPPRDGRAMPLPRT